VRFNTLYLLYIAILGACVYALLWMLLNADAGAFRARFDFDTRVRLIGGILVFVAVLFVIVWFGAVFSAISSGETLDPIVRLVSTLDLTVSLPVAFLGGVLLWRRHPWGYVISALGLLNVVLYMVTLMATNGLLAVMGRTVEPLMLVYAFVCLLGIIGMIFYLRSVESQIW
jgi:hypothetical protein